MKKKENGNYSFGKRGRRCSLFLFFLLFFWQSSVMAQSKSVTLNLKNTTLTEVLAALEKQSDYTFLSRKDQTGEIKGLNVVCRDKSVYEVLDLCLQNTGLTYKQVDNTIVIVPRPQEVRDEAKDLTIRGVVSDETGNPLPGATIRLKGTHLGTATDEAGKFRFTISSAVSDPVLLVSFIGYSDLEIKYRGENDLNIRMSKNQAELEEVVVTGLFTRKAESFTGSAKTISGKELERVGNGNIFQSLKNLDPSLNIMDNLEFGSDPNKLPTMQLRGTSTFPVEGNSDLRSNYQDDPNQPLFILDGFEASATKIFDLDMNRVQSLTILKDAAAKAIYGSKAANGVIVIETRKPVGGEFRVTYKGSVEVTVPDLSSYNLANAAEKLEIERIAGLYESSYLPEHQYLQDQYNERKKAVSEGLDTDWLSKPLHTGIGTKHAISFEMGTNSLTGMVDFSYNNVKGAMKGSEREIIAGSVNLAYRLNHKFLFRNIASITSNRSDDSPYGEFSEYAGMNPYFSPYDKSGEITKENNNPLYNATLNTKQTSGYLEFTNNFYTEYQILEGLKAVARIGITTQRSDGDIFYPANHTKFADWTEDKFLKRGSYQ